LHLHLHLQLHCNNRTGLTMIDLDSVFVDAPEGLETCVWAVWDLLAAALSRLPTVRRVEIDRRLALLEFASEQLVRPAAALWDEFSGMFSTKAGRFVRLHCNAPHHRAAALKLIFGSSDNSVSKEQLQQRLLEWDAFELERRARECGAVVAACRTTDEWEQTETARHIATAPLIEFAAASTPPIARSACGSTTKPLAGIKVVDLTRVLAGPICCRLLAQYGATVTRVFSSACQDPDVLLRDTARGKRSVELDLKSAAGLASLKQLLAEADVLVSAFRPGVLEELGLGSDEQIAAAFPRLIVARLSAFGDADGRRGFDSIVQTASGMNLAHGGGAVPRPLPFQLLDHATGVLLASAIVDAVACAPGSTRIARCSLAATARWWRQTFEGQRDVRSFPRRPGAAAARIADVDVSHALEPHPDRDGVFVVKHCMVLL
jgi:crotonobetainyl-CoA:carnitine CoA-transferase CaiB-like acyl-CoA transferase